MNRDYWFVLSLAIAVAGSFAYGIHFGWEGATNSHYLAMANGVEIRTDGNQTTVDFPDENVWIEKKNGQIKLITWLGYRNAIASSEKGTFMIGDFGSIIIPSQASTPMPAAKDYDNKMLVIPYATWEKYRKARDEMNLKTQPLIVRALADLGQKNKKEEAEAVAAIKARYNVTGNRTAFERDLVAHQNNIANQSWAIRNAEEKRYICAANTSTIKALMPLQA